MKPDLFGNKPNKKSHAGVDEVFYDPAKVPIPAFLPDTIETREELANYYQSCSRIDQGLGRLVQILKEADLYEKTMIVFTSDHGMAFAGGKTTVYEGGLRVPFVVRNPYEKNRGVKSNAMISHIDITPSLLDFADGLNTKTNGPKNIVDGNKYWQKEGRRLKENRGRKKFRSYQGKSWFSILGDPDAEHWDTIFASHTFHEIQDVLSHASRPRQAVQTHLEHRPSTALPFASDLWAASSWQAQLMKGGDAPYGQKTVDEYVNRPRFELYDVSQDPNEARNLAGDPEYYKVLRRYQEKLKSLQKGLEDPWITKWDYE